MVLILFSIGFCNRELIWQVGSKICKISETTHVLRNTNFIVIVPKKWKEKMQNKRKANGEIEHHFWGWLTLFFPKTQMELILPYELLPLLVSDWGEREKPPYVACVGSYQMGLPSLLLFYWFLHTHCLCYSCFFLNGKKFLLILKVLQD